MAKITIDGLKYTVTENGGYQNGLNTKFVSTLSGEKVAVKERTGWRFWEPKDRMAPLKGGERNGKNRI